MHQDSPKTVALSGLTLRIDCTATGPLMKLDKVIECESALLRRGVVHRQEGSVYSPQIHDAMQVQGRVGMRLGRRELLEADTYR